MQKLHGGGEGVGVGYFSIAEGEEIGTMLSDLNEKSMAPMLEHAKPVEPLRPFIPPDLYQLYKAYIGIISGATFNTITKYRKGTITHWKNEENLKKLIITALTEKEIEHIYGLEFESFSPLIDLLEIKIISCINLNLTGSRATTDTIEQLKNLEDILLSSRR